MKHERRIDRVPAGRYAAMVVEKLMAMVTEKRIAVEKLIVAALDLIIDARGLDGEMLFLPQRDLRARYLLRDGRVPDEVLDRIITIAERSFLTAATFAAHDVSKAAA